jgi:nucleoside phosphorylase
MNEKRRILIVTTETDQEWRTLCKGFKIATTQPKGDLGIHKAFVGNFELNFAISGKGPILCALKTIQLIQEIGPEIAILVGVAAGLKSKYKIGDVATSDSVMEYQSGKKEKDGFRNRPTTRTTPSNIQEIVAKVIETHGEPWSKNNLKTDTNFRPTAHKAVGFASGNMVVNDGILLPELHKINDKITALEMEGIGFASACELGNKTPWLMVRGICDNAENKSDLDRAYVAKNAVSFVQLFLEMGFFKFEPDHTPHRPQQTAAFCGVFNCNDSLCNGIRELNKQAQLCLQKFQSSNIEITNQMELALKKYGDLPGIFHRFAEIGVKKIGQSSDMNKEYKQFFESINNEVTNLKLMGTSLKRIFCDEHFKQGSKNRKKLIEALNNQLKLQVIINNPFNLSIINKNKNKPIPVSQINRYKLKIDPKRLSLYLKKGSTSLMQAANAYMLNRIEEKFVDNSCETLRSLYEIWEKCHKKENIEIKMTDMPFYVSLNYLNIEAEPRHMAFAEHYMNWGVAKKSNVVFLQGIGENKNLFIESYLNEFNNYWDVRNTHFADFIYTISFDDDKITLSKEAD